MARRITFEVEDEAPLASVESSSRAPSLSGMARSLQAAAAATIREIPVDQIDASGFRDRLEMDEEEVEELAHSIRQQGQLIPILVSPLPQGRYRIVYGRRRLEALRRLGLPAKALVRDLDDTQAIIAQGQENSVRKDLSWIEKASFARELLDAGRSDELVCDALNIDQKARRSGDKLTGLSRMRQVTARLEAGLIEAVGPAPSVGRDRWYDLSMQIERKSIGPDAQDLLIAEIQTAREAGMADSNERFSLLEMLINRKDQAPRTVEQEAVNEFRGALGLIKVNARSANITIKAKDAVELHAWIRDNPDAALQALQRACAEEIETKEKGSTV